MPSYAILKINVSVKELVSKTVEKKKQWTLNKMPIRVTSTIYPFADMNTQGKVCSCMFPAT